jgi:hypothetical protein
MAAAAVERSEVVDAFCCRLDGVGGWMAAVPVGDSHCRFRRRRVDLDFASWAGATERDR